LSSITHEQAIRILIDCVYYYGSVSSDIAQKARSDTRYSAEKADKLSIELLNYKVPLDGHEQLRAAVKRENELVAFCLAVYKLSLQQQRERFAAQPDSPTRARALESVDVKLSHVDIVAHKFDLALPPL
jgi:hypothetical protein